MQLNMVEEFVNRDLYTHVGKCMPKFTNILKKKNQNQNINHFWSCVVRPGNLNETHQSPFTRERMLISLLFCQAIFFSREGRVHSGNWILRCSQQGWPLLLRLMNRTQRGRRTWLVKGRGFIPSLIISAHKVVSHRFTPCPSRLATTAIALHCGSFLWNGIIWPAPSPSLVVWLALLPQLPPEQMKTERKSYNWKNALKRQQGRQEWRDY